MRKYEYLNEMNLVSKEYAGFTLEELIEDIGYYHMTGRLKSRSKNGKYDENYHKIVKIYTEYPQNRKKIIEILTTLNNDSFNKNQHFSFSKNGEQCTE